MKKRFLFVAVMAALLVGPMNAWCADHWFSLGYGIAAFNKDRSFGRLEGHKPYSFIQATYIYERPLSQKELAFLVEPFAAYVVKPTAGADFGLDVGLKYYPFQTDNGGFYLTAGPGVAYTTVGFKEQGTHLLFILQGGVGYRYKSFFIEDRVRHYSNGSTASPNWSVNSNILSVGTLW
jgi:hypothetical protein